MRLADRIAQCKTPFAVQNTRDGTIIRLTGAANFGTAVAGCPIRYVFSDALTRLCTALAYSKGARTLECADLLHVPAERLWLEWCEAPWESELSLYGFRQSKQGAPVSGRRGALIQASSDGRRGLIKSFWSLGERESEVLASSMEAYFDFDTEEDGEPTGPDSSGRPAMIVFDRPMSEADVLRRCFRFRYEQSWADYYAAAQLSPFQQAAVARHALGTIAIAIPVILAFFLLLGMRPGLPCRPLMLERLNQARRKSGKTPLLDHIEVSSPVFQEYRFSAGGDSGHHRRTPRLHHVRGHLVRRGSQLFWRVPHLRGRARSGIVKTRTVTWTVESRCAR
jgi:hypothetical protein